MAKEIKFNVKLTVDGKEQLVTATLQSKRPTTGTVRLWVFCFNIHHSKVYSCKYTLKSGKSQTFQAFTAPAISPYLLNSSATHSLSVIFAGKP